MNILSVDDDAFILELIEFYGKSHGFEVTTLDCPTKVYDELDAKHYDALITDYMMPSGSEGMELIRSLRNSENHKNLPILALSIMIRNEEEREFLISNGVWFISKPFDGNHLMESVKNAIAQKKEEQLSSWS